MSDDSVDPAVESDADRAPGSHLPPGWGPPVTDEQGHELLQDPAETDRHAAVEEVGYSPTSTTPRSVINDRAAGGPI